MQAYLRQRFGFMMASLAILVGACAGNSEAEAEDQIFGGTVSSPAHDAVLRLKLYWKTDEQGRVWSANCGATLVHPRIAVTAKHCVQDPDAWDAAGLLEAPLVEPSRLTLYGGVRADLAYPDFVQAVVANEALGWRNDDVAFLVLNDSIEAPRYASLPQNRPTPGTVVQVLGWGCTDFWSSALNASECGVPRDRRVARATVRSCLPLLGEDCDEEFSTAFVAGHGDSGGPALDPSFRVVGVVSTANARGQLFAQTASFLSLADRAFALVGATRP